MINISVVTPGPGSVDAYRVVPDSDDPVILQIQDRLVKVREISASGITTVAEALDAGQRYRFVLDLPNNRSSVEGLLETSLKTENGTLRCQFVELLPDQVDKIHHYVLQRQKQVIRSLRGRT